MGRFCRPRNRQNTYLKTRAFCLGEFFHLKKLLGGKKINFEFRRQFKKNILERPQFLVLLLKGMGGRDAVFSKEKTAPNGQSRFWLEKKFAGQPLFCFGDGLHLGDLRGALVPPPIQQN